MTRKNLNQEIQQARDEILILGSMVEEAMLNAVGALKNHNMAASREVLAKDQAINAKRYGIEAMIITTIATQQPAARDLRLLASILEICADLERMGDYAKGIASINLRSGGLNLPKMLRDIQFMGQKVVDMLHRSLTAFINEDDQAAVSLAKEDDLIDALYQQLYFEVMDFVAENPHDIERSNSILWSGHNLERMADRVTNICERTVFVKTGEIAVEFE